MSENACCFANLLFHKDLQQKGPAYGGPLGAVLPPFDAEPFSATGGLMRPEGACISDAGLRLPKNCPRNYVANRSYSAGFMRRSSRPYGADPVPLLGKDPSLRTAEPSAGAAAEKDVQIGTSSARCSTHAASPAYGFAGESISLANRTRASGGRAYDAGIPPLFRSSVRPYAAHRPLSIVASEYAVTLPYFVAYVKPPGGGSWKLESWKLEVGRWKLGDGRSGRADAAGGLGVGRWERKGREPSGEDRSWKLGDRDALARRGSRRSEFGDGSGRAQALR